jgi:hypothetical protein
MPRPLTNGVCLKACDVFQSTRPQNQSKDPNRKPRQRVTVLVTSLTSLPRCMDPEGDVLDMVGLAGRDARRDGGSTSGRGILLRLITTRCMAILNSDRERAPSLVMSESCLKIAGHTNMVMSMSESCLKIAGHTIMVMSESCLKIAGHTNM